MILSESEKNRIKGLYGLVTEATTISDIFNNIKKNDVFSKIKNIKLGSVDEMHDQIIRLIPDSSQHSTLIKNELEKIKHFNSDELVDFIQDNYSKIDNLKINEQSNDNGSAIAGVLMALIYVAIIHEQNKKREKERKKREEKWEEERLEREKQREIEKQKEEEERQRRYEEYKRQEEERRRQKEELEAKIDEENKVFRDLKGKSVNLYNDNNQQILYGEILIKKLRFNPQDKSGGRSSIAIYTNSDFRDDYSYEIICLSNPDRLAPYIVEKGKYLDDLKYNKSFVSAVKKRAGNFCQKPKADFGSIDKSTDSSKLA